MARQLARRYVGSGEPLDDLIQVAAVALINAVDRFDPGRQVAFATFAVPTIVGALKRHFRDSTWTMRTARRVQELTLDLAIATADLSQQLGRTPTTADLADHLRLSPEDVTRAITAAKSRRPMSLNSRRADGDDAEPAEFIDLIGDPDPRYADVDIHLTIRPLFAALPLRERRILTMRFSCDMTQAQIATKIGLSQMHVSRLLTQSINRLRTGMVG